MEKTYGVKLSHVAASKDNAKSNIEVGAKLPSVNHLNPSLGSVTSKQSLINKPAQIMCSNDHIPSAGVEAAQSPMIRSPSIPVDQVPVTQGNVVPRTLTDGPKEMVGEIAGWFIASWAIPFR